MARPKKEAAEKKEVVMQTPGQIMSVVFTIPTNIPYESVKVEISGVADNNELATKYNELVALFRPGQAPIAPKEPFKPYVIPRKVEAEDDEPQGRRTQKATSNLNLGDMQKMDIVNLLHKNYQFTSVGKKKEEIEAKVLEVTGFELKPENYTDIIEKLRV